MLPPAVPAAAAVAAAQVLLRPHRAAAEYCVTAPEAEARPACARRLEAAGQVAGARACPWWDVWAGSRRVAAEPPAAAVRPAHLEEAATAVPQW